MRFTARDLSVVIPVKDGESFVERAFKSVRKISHDIEVVFVESGSSDGSLIECERLADTKTQVIHLEQPGVSRARNHGVFAAQGRIVTTLDADDEMLPNRVSFLERRNWVDTELVIGCMELGEGTESIYPMAIQKTLTKGLPMYADGALIFTKFGFMNLGGYKEDLQLAQNMDLILRAKKLGFTIIYTSELFLIRHFHTKSISYDREASALELFSSIRGNLRHRNWK